MISRKSLASKRAALAANRLKKYQDQMGKADKFVPGARSFHINGMQTQRFEQQPLVTAKSQAMFNPELIDGPSNLTALPELKRSVICLEVNGLLIVGNLCT